MITRDNEAWLEALSRPGEAQVRAIEDLREYLMRAVLVYLGSHRGDLVEWSASEIRHFADDIVQEALLAIQKKLTSFRGDSKFTTWAYRFVINMSASELRRRRYRELSLESLQEQEARLVAVKLQGKREVDPGVEAERRAFLELLDQIIQEELTERQRQAFLGVHVQDLSMQEVAHLLGISRNTLYKLLHDARRKLKVRLQARYVDAKDVLTLFEN